MSTSPKTTPTQTPALDALVDALRTEFRHEARGTRIAELMATYAREQNDWEAFALFRDESYTRNLVAREDRFELLVICWDAGQESPIHNHEGQDCWMAVLAGQIEEVRFCSPEEVRPGPLSPRGSQVFPSGQVAFIKDEIGLHVVRSAVPTRRGVSLHLYAAPYDECNCYCPDTGQVTRTALANYSFRGRVL